MEKRAAGVVCMAIVLSLFVPAVSGAQFEWHTSAGFDLITTTDFMDVFGYAFNTEVGIPRTPLYLQFGFTQNRGTTNNPNHFYIGDYKQITYDFNLIATRRIKSVYQLYVGGGYSSYSEANIKFVGSVGDYLRNANRSATQKINSASGYNYNFGIFVFTTPRVSLFLDIKSHFMEPDVTTINTDLSTGIATTIIESYKFQHNYFSTGIRVGIFIPQKRR